MTVTRILRHVSLLCVLCVLAHMADYYAYLFICVDICSKDMHIHLALISVYAFSLNDGRIKKLCLSECMNINFVCMAIDILAAWI